MSRAVRPKGKVLLIANNFPPVRGGSAVVYASIARCAAGQVIVVAPCINYADGLPIIAGGSMTVMNHTRSCACRCCALRWDGRQGMA